MWWLGLDQIIYAQIINICIVACLVFNLITGYNLYSQDF